MNNIVFVLNNDFSFLGTIDWQRSIVLLYQEKAEIVKETEKVIYNTDKTVSFIVPRIIRLIKGVVDIFKSKITYSKANVFLRDKYTCQYCGKKLENAECTIDHVIPRVKGGKTKWNNVATSCKKCNNAKADRDLRDCGMRLKRSPQAPSVSEFLRMKSKIFSDMLDL